MNVFERFLRPSTLLVIFLKTQKFFGKKDAFWIGLFLRLWRFFLYFYVWTVFSMIDSWKRFSHWLKMHMVIYAFRLSVCTNDSCLSSPCSDICLDVFDGCQYHFFSGKSGITTILQSCVQRWTTMTTIFLLTGTKWTSRMTRRPIPAALCKFSRFVQKSGVQQALISIYSFLLVRNITLLCTCSFI